MDGNNINNIDNIDNIDSNPNSQTPPKKKKKKSILREYIIPLTIDMIVVYLLIQYVFFLARVPTGSMLPTISIESWIFSTRIHSVEDRVDRGDIIVFEGNPETDKTLIKRCIGLPGDYVNIDVEGNVYINGDLLDEPYVKYPDPGVAQQFDVPEGHYLFFGDNRAGSGDARVWSDPYIPAENIIGEAHFTILPFDNFGFLD